MTSSKLHANLVKANSVERDETALAWRDGECAMAAEGEEERRSEVKGL